MSSPQSPQPTLLLAGRGERMADALRAALSERGISAEQTSVSLLVQRAYVETPDLIVLIGDGAKDGGRVALAALAQNAGTAATPVVLVADSARLGAKIDAFRHGVVAVVARTASVEQLAESIAAVARDLPQRAGEITGGLAETSVDELVELLSEELRSGILSIGAGGASAQVVLQADRPFSEVVGELVEKLRPLVGAGKGAPLSYEFYETPGARLGSLDLDLPHDTATDVLRGRRLLLIEENAARSDILVQELRAAGAEVVVADGEGNGLARARLLDPEVAIVDGASDTGWALGALRALRRDPRLRWASLLLTDPTQLWQDREPDIARLASSIAPLVAHDIELTERAKGEPAFDVRIEAIGPTRLLRALVSTGLGLRVRLAHPLVVAEIDVSEGLVVGASADTGSERIEGVAAIATFCALGAGRAQVERKDAPATTNVMAPLAEALAASEREQSLVAPSLPPPKDEPEPQKPSLSAGNDPARVVKRLEQLLARLDNVVAKGMTRAPRLSPTPARPIRMVEEISAPGLGPTPVKPFKVPEEAFGETRKHPRLAPPTPTHAIVPPPDARPPPAASDAKRAKAPPGLSKFNEDSTVDTGQYAVDALQKLKENAHRSEPPPAKKVLPPAKPRPQPAQKGPRVRARQPTLVGSPSPLGPVAPKVVTPKAARDDEPSVEIQTETWGRSATPKSEPQKPAEPVAKPAAKTPSPLAKPVAAKPVTSPKPEPAPAEKPAESAPAADAAAAQRKPLRSRQSTLVGASIPTRPAAPSPEPAPEPAPLELVRRDATAPIELIRSKEEEPSRDSIEIAMDPEPEPELGVDPLRQTELAAPVVPSLRTPTPERAPVEYVPSDPPPAPQRQLRVSAEDEAPPRRSRGAAFGVVIVLLLLVPAAGAGVWYFYFRDLGRTADAPTTPEREEPRTEEPEETETPEAPEIAETETPETPETETPETPEAETPETPETETPEAIELAGAADGVIAADAPLEGREEDFSLAAIGVEPGSAPGGPNALTRLLQGANARRGREQWAEAATMYRQALALDAENPRATAGLALVLIADRQGPLAVTVAQRLVRLRPTYGSNFVLLGDALEAAGDHAAARRAWTRARELDPDLTSARDRLREHPE